MANHPNRSRRVEDASMAAVETMQEMRSLLIGMKQSGIINTDVLYRGFIDALDARIAGITNARQIDA